MADESIGNNGTQQAQALKLLEHIFNLDLQHANIALCLASAQSNSDIPAFRRINLSQDIADMFREVIATVLEPYKKGTDEGNIALHDFSADTTQPEDEIEYLNISSYITLVQQTAPLEHYLDMAAFQQNDRVFVEGLRFHAIVVQPPQGLPVSFFRKYTHTQLLSQSPYFAMQRIFQRDIYSKVSEPTFLFDRHIDCMACGDYMYILQKYNFYLIFRFLDALEETGEKVLEFLKLKDFIHNFDRFRRDCMGNKTKLLTLKNISMQPYLKTITIDDLERTINAYPQDIAIEIKRINGKKKLLYNHSRPWEILHLLNDNYVDSPMTAASYHARSKRGVRKS